MAQRLPAALKGCQKIGLVGLGVSNKGVLSYLEGCEGDLHFTVRTKEKSAETKYAARCGEGYLDKIEEDALILSPSVHPKTKEILAAKARGVRILTDAEIFFRDTKARCFAVSGSDGKSTTTALLAHLLCAAFKKEIPAAGNIGRALTPLLRSEPYAVACELSSFQLSHYAPKAERAVITNLSPNHLDFHESLEDYENAKARLYERCVHAAVCLDGVGSLPLLKKPPFSVYSLEKTETDMAKCKADFAYYIKNDAVYENGRRFFPLSFFPLSGRHNLYNLLAAYALGAGIFTSETAMEARSFRPLAHRSQTVGTIGGVRFIDSSIDSSPSRTAQTLAALSSPVILLLGGKGKKLPLHPLLAPLFEKCRGAVCFGPFGKEAHAFLSENGYEGLLPPPKAGLADAFTAALALAREGDTVLLSPGATSFDEFENFAARGEFFRRLVEEQKNKMEML